MLIPKHIRRTAAPMLQHKKLLALSLATLGVSALTFGAGIGMLTPVFSLMLKSQVPLAEVIKEGMEKHPFLRPAGDVLLRIIPSDQFHAFVAVMAIMVVLTVVGAVAKYVQAQITAWVVARTVQHWQKKLMERICRMRVEESWRRGSHDLIGRMIFETASLAGGLNAMLGNTPNALVRVVVSLCGAFYYNWQLTLAALVGVGVIGGSVSIINRQIRKAIHKESASRTGMHMEADRTASNPMTIKVACSEFSERRRFHVAAQTAMHNGIKRLRIRGLSSNLNEMLGMIGLCLISCFAAYQILNMKADPDSFIKMMFSLGMAITSLKPVSEFSHEMQVADVASERILDILDNMEAEPVTHHERIGLPRLPRLSREIEFRGVTYTYPGKKEPALRDLSLTIKAGEFVAIVGANGSGKSTLMLLLSRMVNPQQGQILLDGHDAVAADIRSMREQMAMVTQKTVLFKGTISDNIAYGCTWEPREKIVAAAKISTADEFIMQMPKGYDMMLGPAGEGMSGGQAQRVCMARAILRDPAILILDEATSQVDPESEARISEAMGRIIKGRTTIAIAHRLSTVLNADRIIVMDQGRIVAMGTHRELLAASEDYRSIAQTQMAG